MARAEGVRAGAGEIEPGRNDGLALARKTVRDLKCGDLAHASVAPWKASAARAPLPEDSYRVPGVEHRDAKAGEILHVPRHDGEIVFKGRRGDHAIRCVERSSS